METINVIMMLYENIKSVVYSTDGITDFFNIELGLIQGDTPLLYVITLDYVLRTSIDSISQKGFIL